MSVKDWVHNLIKWDGSASSEYNKILLVANITLALLHCYHISFINVKCINMLYFYTNIKRNNFIIKQQKRVCSELLEAS